MQKLSLRDSTWLQLRKRSLWAFSTQVLQTQDPLPWTLTGLLAYHSILLQKLQALFPIFRKVSILPPGLDPVTFLSPDRKEHHCDFTTKELLVPQICHLSYFRLNIMAPLLSSTGTITLFPILITLALALPVLLVSTYVYVCVLFPFCSHE